MTCVPCTYSWTNHTLYWDSFWGFCLLFTCLGYDSADSIEAPESEKWQYIRAGTEALDLYDFERKIYEETAGNLYVAKSKTKFRPKTWANWFHFFLQVYSWKATTFFGPVHHLWSWSHSNNICMSPKWKQREVEKRAREVVRVSPETDNFLNPLKDRVCWVSLTYMLAR
jgi:hypothetical protein